MTSQNKTVLAVAEVYDRIDAQTAVRCEACGKCCNFESYGHKLFVTTPELIYFAEKLKPENIKPMPTPRCPYNLDGKCTVYPHRFAGCRIFSCTADTETQSQITELTLQKLKSICNESKIPYTYTDLQTALNTNCN